MPASVPGQDEVWKTTEYTEYTEERRFSSVYSVYSMVSRSNCVCFYQEGTNLNWIRIGIPSIFTM
jgi:hypothetical protein